jgi:hypothetical protein
VTYVDGQPESQLSALVYLRDILTENYIRAPNRLNLSDRGASHGFFRDRMARTLGFDVSIFDPNGLVGFGVGYEEAMERPELLVFAGKERDRAARLHSELKENGIPVRLYDGVTFRAASARPVKGGQSIGHGIAGGETGTMGCVVKDRSSGDLFALSCNHVIADYNNAKKGSTKVWAPGPKTIGTPAVGPGTQSDELGVVHDFARIDFTSGVYNFIDSAIAKPKNTADLDRLIEHIGAPSGSNSAVALGDVIKKTGAASGLTTGKYRYQINAEIEYNTGQKALFRDLLGIVNPGTGDFAEQGDSGAVLLDDKDAVVGQLISVAQGLDLTLAAPIKTVLDHFKMDIA